MSAEARAFVDTNVLAYAYDATAGSKHEDARSLVAGLWESRQGCLSIQVLQEFFVTVTRKLPERLDVPRAAAAVGYFSEWTIHVPVARDVSVAIELHERHRVSFWDAMILHSAAALGCDVLYTEDLDSGQRFDGVDVVDPFA